MKKGFGLLSFLAMGLGLFAQNPCANLPKITVNVTDSTPCFGDSIAITASGAQSYFWNKGIVNGQSFFPSKSDTFRLIATHSNGCKNTLFTSIELLQLPNIQINPTPNNLCQGDSVLLEATGGASYKWLNPPINNAENYIPSILGTNTFKVEGQSANGCKNSAQVSVVVKPIPSVPTLTTDSISTCVEVDFKEQIVATTDSGQVIWYTDKQYKSKHQQEGPLRVKTSPVGKQVYYATTHLGGCNSPSVRAVAEVLPGPTIDAGSDMGLTAGDKQNFSPSIPENSTVLWLPNFYLENNEDPFTELVATNTITFTMHVTDEFGCKGSDSLLVTVESNLTIANIITPDGDGDDDTWKIFPESELAKCKVVVFDNYGRKIFESSNYQNDWGGTFEGETLPAGNYYFHLSGPEIDKKGTITLMR